MKPTPCSFALSFAVLSSATIPPVLDAGWGPAPTISFSGMDDGSRVTIFNSVYPGGFVIPGSCG